MVRTAVTSVLLRRRRRCCRLACSVCVGSAPCISAAYTRLRPCASQAFGSSSTCLCTARAPAIDTPFFVQRWLEISLHTISAYLSLSFLSPLILASLRVRRYLPSFSFSFVASTMWRWC